MEKHTLTYYKWSDVKQLLCKELNVTEEEFDTVNRSGLRGFDNHITYEDIFNSVFIDEEYGYLRALAFFCVNHTDVNAEKYIEEYDPQPYKIPLIKAVYKLIEEHKIEYIMFS